MVEKHARIDLKCLISAQALEFSLWAILKLKRGKTLDIVNFQAYFTLQTINLEIDIFEMFWSFSTDPIKF